MGITKGEMFDRDVFIDYPYETVMFRWDSTHSKIYRKFYGQMEHIVPIPHDDHLYNEALRFGDEISEEKYARGK